MNITVDIPVEYLLTIAVYGTMGDGRLPEIMHVWAQKACEKNGLHEQMVDLQIEHMKELEIRIRNTLGDTAIQQIHASIDAAVKCLKQV